MTRQVGSNRREGGRATRPTPQGSPGPVRSLDLIDLLSVPILQGLRISKGQPALGLIPRDNGILAWRGRLGGLEERGRDGSWEGVLRLAEAVLVGCVRQWGMRREGAGCSLGTIAENHVGRWL